MRTFTPPSSAGWNGGFGMTRIEDNFNPALGFVRRRGIDQTNFDLGHTWRPRGGAIRTISSSVEFERIEYLSASTVATEYTGAIQSDSTRFQLLNINLNSQDGFNINFNRDREAEIAFVNHADITNRPMVLSILGYDETQTFTTLSYIQQRNILKKGSRHCSCS